MNNLFLFLISTEARAVSHLADAAADLRNVCVRHSETEADFWEVLRGSGSGLLERPVILAWGMPAGFVRALKSDSASNSIPVVACLPESDRAEVEALYDAGANCVVEVNCDSATVSQRLRTALEFWSLSATLPSHVRTANRA